MNPIDKLQENEDCLFDIPKLEYDKKNIEQVILK